MIMDLAEAKDLFDHNPSDKACAYLLDTALDEHRRGKIDLLTLERHVMRVIEWLKDE